MSYQQQQQRPTSPNVERVRRWPEFYLEGGDLVFLIENWLFRVHRFFFERESLYFKHRLCSPLSPGQQREGSSESIPLLLEDVTAEDFGRFCSVFYNPKYSLYDHMTVEEWTSVLRLSHHWQFSEVKELAIRELEKYTISPIDKIALYQTYDVPGDLLVPSYLAVTVRAAPLSVDEGRQLGLETSLSLSRARELARNQESPRMAEGELETVVREVIHVCTPPVPTLLVTGATTPAFVTSPKLNGSAGSSVPSLNGGSGMGMGTNPVTGGNPFEETSFHAPQRASTIPEGAQGGIPGSQSHLGAGAGQGNGNSWSGRSPPPASNVPRRGSGFQTFSAVGGSPNAR